jgi:hypothetical protein
LKIQTRKNFIEHQHNFSLANQELQSTTSASHW